MQQEWSMQQLRKNRAQLRIRPALGGAAVALLCAASLWQPAPACAAPHGGGGGGGFHAGQRLRPAILLGAGEGTLYFDGERGRIRRVSPDCLFLAAETRRVLLQQIELHPVGQWRNLLLICSCSGPFDWPCGSCRA